MLRPTCRQLPFFRLAARFRIQSPQPDERFLVNSSLRLDNPMHSGQQAPAFGTAIGVAFGVAMCDGSLPEAAQAGALGRIDGKSWYSGLFGDRPSSVAATQVLLR